MAHFLVYSLHTFQSYDLFNADTARAGVFRSWQVFSSLQNLPFIASYTQPCLQFHTLLFPEHENFFTRNNEYLLGRFVNSAGDRHLFLSRNKLATELVGGENKFSTCSSSSLLLPNIFLKALRRTLVLCFEKTRFHSPLLHLNSYVKLYVSLYFQARNLQLRQPGLFFVQSLKKLPTLNYSLCFEDRISLRYCKMNELQITGVLTTDQLRKFFEFT